MYSRVPPTESQIYTCARVIDTLEHRHQVVPVLGLLVITAFSRSLRFLPLCVSTQTGLSRGSRHSRRAPARYTRWSDKCRSSSDALRPTEVVFRSLEYYHLSSRRHMIHCVSLLHGQLLASKHGQARCIPNLFRYGRDTQ
jgi:hypothetical protein